MAASRAMKGMEKIGRMTCVHGALHTQENKERNLETRCSRDIKKHSLPHHCVDVAMLQAKTVQEFKSKFDKSRFEDTSP